MKNKAKKVISWLLTFVIITSGLPALSFKASAATVPSITMRYCNTGGPRYPHPNGVAVDTRNGDVYLSDDRGVEKVGTPWYTGFTATCVKYYDGFIYAYNHDKGRKDKSLIGTLYSRIVGINTNPDDGSSPYGSSEFLSYLGDFAFDSKGDIFYAENNHLLRITMQNQYAVFYDYYPYPDRAVNEYSGLAADDDRNVYVANSYTNEIEKIDVNDVCTVIAPIKASHLVLDNNRNIYANGDGKLYRIDKLGNVVTILSSGVSDNGMCLLDYALEKKTPLSFEVDANQNDTYILIANSEKNEIDEATFPTPKDTSFSVSVDKSYTKFNTSAALTASGLPTDATGTVTFKNIDGTVLGTASVSDGKASCPTATTLPIGNYNDITAVYSGDINYLGSISTQSTALTVTGTAAATLTASVRDSSVAYGTPDTLTASVLPADATGTVTFTDSTGKSLGTATVSNGTASCTTATNLSAKTYDVTAAYCGDSTYAPSNATTSFTITPNDSTITLTESVPYAAMGSSDKVTFTVGNIPENANPKVELSATKAGESPIQLSIIGSPGNTSATFSPDMSAFSCGYGDYTITAAFTDLSKSNASSAATVHFALTGNSDAGFSVPSGIKTFNRNDSVVLTANTYQAGATGTVSFYNSNGDTFLGSAPLSHGTAKCTLSSGALPAGNTQIKAVYSGDDKYKGVAINDGSYSVSINNTYSAAFSVSATANPFVVRADNIPSDATGSVSFSYKQSSGGSSTTIQSGVSITNGSAVYAVKNALNSLSNGTYLVTATYTPNNSAQSKYASASETGSFTISKAAPQITSADNASFMFGSPGTFTVSTANYPLASLSETGPLPGGVTFTDNSDGTATIAGTPTTKGSYPIKITAANGTSPDATQSFTLKVDPENSTISLYSVYFDKNTVSSDYADIPVTLKLNGNTLTEIDNGSTPLNSGTDYTVSGNTVTLLKTYLANLPTGDTSLTFKFDGGDDATLTVTTNTAPARKNDVNATATASTTVNTPYTLNLSNIFADADKDGLTYKVSVNGAADIAADASYSYTPTATGTDTLVFKASDGTTDSPDTYTVTLTVNATVTLSSIAITTAAAKRSYAVGDNLDLTGLVVTGTYSDGSTKQETVTADNVSGFDSSAANASETLTVTVGGKTTTYTIAVNAAVTLSSIAITTAAAKRSYTVGDSLDLTGLVVTGTYSDGSTKQETVTADNVSGFDSSKPAASQTLTVTVGGQTATYTIAVNAAVTLSSIAITTAATKRSYAVGDSLDLTGLVVIGTYSDGSTKQETVTADNVSGFDSSAANASETLTVTVGGKTTTYTIAVNAAVTLSSIAITTAAAKRSYAVGDSLDLTGLVVTGTYSDGSTKQETVTADNVTGFDSSKPMAHQTLTVTAGGKTAMYMVEIKAKEETSGIVSAFSSLADSVKTQTVTLGTAISTLPQKLKAVVDGISNTFVSVAKWVSDITYNPNIAGTYDFTPVLDSGYQLKDSGVQLPHITVRVVSKGVPSSNSESSSSEKSASASSTQTDVNTAANTAVVSTVANSTSVNGNTAEIAVNVPTVTTDTGTSASLDTGKKASVEIDLPKDSIIQQLSAKRDVALTVTVPSDVAANRNSNLAVDIKVDSDIFDAAKTAQTDVTVSVRDARTQQLAYSWTFKGEDLAKSTVPVTNVNIAMSVHSAAEMPQVSTAAPGHDGVVLSFEHSGPLPAVASVRISVAGKGYQPGQTLYFYYFNPVTQQIEQLDSNAYTVDADGYVTVQISHCSNYVLLPRAARFITLDTRNYTMAPNGSYEIGVKRTGAAGTTLKAYSSTKGVADVTVLRNGNVQVNGLRTGLTYIMIDVYDSKNKRLTHASVRLNVQSGVKPGGNSQRQYGTF